MRTVSLCVLLLTFLAYPLQATTVDTENIDQTSAGTYPVTVTYIDETSGQKITKTAYMTVTYPKTTINKELGEGIDAHDIITEKHEPPLTNEQLITMADAHAWSLEDGSSIPITNVTRTIKDPSINLYQIVFATAKGTTATIQLLETDTTTMFVETQEYIYLEDENSSFQTATLISIFTLGALPLLLLAVVYIIIQRQSNKMIQLLHEERLFSMPTHMKKD